MSFHTDDSKPIHKLIIGDNYEALQNLLIQYKNKVDVIYIDPPYGKDSMGEFAKTNYENAITRDNLLSMLHSRLMLAKMLLSDNGVIFCSIDDKNQAYVKCLFDEVFGESNFMSSICREAIKGGTKTKNIKQVHDYVIVYAKQLNDGKEQKEILIGEEFEESFRYEFEDEKGKYAKGRELNKWGAGSRREDSPSMWFPITGPNGIEVFPIRNDGSEGRWRWGKKKLSKAVEEGDVLFEKREDGTYIAYEKIREDRTKNKQLKSILGEDFINAKGSEDLKDVFNTLMSPFNYAKPVSLIEELIQYIPTDDFVVLDFFAGSGTTGHAVLDLNAKDEGNRTFILCQLNEKTETTPNGIASDITTKRLKRIMTGECYDGTKDFKWIEENQPYGGNLDVYEIESVANFAATEGETPFDVIDETLYGKEKFKTLREKIEWVCGAPTGSGKTHMMADFMNRMLGSHPDLVFLVSTLSKGNLAEQNYKVFKNCADKNIFPNLNPHLISSEASVEERLFIPEGFNVYVLPRDLYKDKSKLKDEGALVNFLETLTSIKDGERKYIWLIRDECHQKTSNLDDIAQSFFEKVINFSATPKLSWGQIPDVEITDEAAMNAKLIKRVELDDEKELLDREKGHHPETALRKFIEIKEKYRNLLGVNPCLIIQISNKDKAEEEWKLIESWLNKPEFKDLKWMSIVDKKDKCMTNDAIGKLPVERWKDYAKEGETIDIIVFKMVISEGWDIPRACMLYQVRDTQSKQLDEQVMGRVRRNPRLLDFETLSAEAQKLATTAWVWGIEPENGKKSRQVKLFGDPIGIPSEVRIKTTRLKQLTERKDFDIAKFISEKSKNDVTSSNIFDLYAKLQRSENEVRDLCYSYADNVAKWFRFCKHIEAVRKEYDTFVCDYAESMEIVKDENGKAKEVSFPLTSLYVDNEHYQNIGNWVWQRKDGSDKFSFDSEAEREWASILKDLSRDYTEPYAEDKCFLWGKNFITNSEIKFEYYLNGIHSSYPDFVMKDRQGYIHLFEVKSVNVSNTAQFDSEEYKEKVNALKRCYLQCSILTEHAFYLPILEDDSWHIHRFLKGKEDMLNKDQFIEALRTAAAMRYDDK